MYQEIISLVPETAKTVLAFGDGPGEPSLSLINERPFIKLLVSDPSPDMIKIAKERFGDRKADFQVLQDTNLVGVGKFDAILASLCFMFVDPARLPSVLSDLGSNLTDQGVIISTHWGDPENVSGLRISKQCRANLENLPIDLSDLCGTGPFSLADSSILRTAYEIAGFEILIWKEIFVPFYFENVNAHLEFVGLDISARSMGIMNTLVDELLESKMIMRGKNGDYTLPNQAFAAVARKRK